MTNEESFKILTENLRDFSKKQSISESQKELTIRELAALLCTSAASIEEIMARFKAHASDVSPRDEILLLSELCRSELHDSIKSSLIIGSTEPTAAGAHSKISFVKNKYNDIAFEHFSRSLTNAKPEYALSFKESCENVIDGRSEFCILPLTNSSDGRLMSFYALLDRYELKICETVDVEDEELSKTVKYARAGRFCKEPNERLDANKSYTFEFSVIDSSGKFLPSLLLAARELDACVTSIDSLPVEYAAHLQRFFISLALPAKNILTLRLFIALSQQSYTPIGIYKEIKNT